MRPDRFAERLAKILARLVIVGVLGLCTSARSSQVVDDTYLEFDVSGSSYRYSELYASQILNRRAKTLDVILGPVRGLLDRGPRYVLFWMTSHTTPPHVGIVTSAVKVAVDIPGTQQFLTNFEEKATVVVTLTVVTQDVVEGTFAGEHLQLIEKSGPKKGILPGDYSVTGTFRAKRRYAEHDG